MDQGKGGSGSKTFLKHFRNSKSTIKEFLFHLLSSLLIESAQYLCAQRMNK